MLLQICIYRMGWEFTRAILYRREELRFKSLVRQIWIVMVRPVLPRTVVNRFSDLFNKHFIQRQLILIIHKTNCFRKQILSHDTGITLAGCVYRKIAASVFAIAWLWASCFTKSFTASEDDLSRGARAISSFVLMVLPAMVVPSLFTIRVCSEAATSLDIKIGIIFMAAPSCMSFASDTSLSVVRNQRIVI